MNPHEFCITDRFETDIKLRKGLAEYADLQQRSTGIHRSVDDKRGAGNNRPQGADRVDPGRSRTSKEVQGGLLFFRAVKT